MTGAVLLMWLDMYEQFSDLTKDEQIKLFFAMKEDLFPDSTTNISNKIVDIREKRFSNGLACVHCGSMSVKRNGTYKARQRYLCKDCGKSFNDMTASPLSGTKYPHKWIKYIEMMVAGRSLRAIAKELKIHLSTAFYWRHKVLFALQSLGHQKLLGIVESDETFFLESDKGKKNLSHRKPRKRGGSASKRGISKEQICVVVAHDRNGQILSEVAGKGRITALEIDTVLGDYLDDTALLCTDTASNYKKFAAMKGLKHEAINARKKEYVRQNIYHIQHVNSYHRRLKDWMERFNGVATKYLNGYLIWHRFLDLNKKIPSKENIDEMLLNACKKANFTTVIDIRNFK